MIKELSEQLEADEDGQYNQLSLFHALNYYIGGSGINGTSYNTIAYVPIAEYVPPIGNFNVNGALTWAKGHVLKKGISYCAAWVYGMIDAGFGEKNFTAKHGTTTFGDGHIKKGRPNSAYQNVGYLPSIGFAHLTTLSGRKAQKEWTENYAQPGDIAVMSHGKHGHICMWTGYNWVSDFVQNKMWVYDGDGTCNIFRYSDGNMLSQ